MRIQGLGHSCGWGPFPWWGVLLVESSSELRPESEATVAVPVLPLLGLARERDHLGSLTYAVLWNPAVRERVS